MSTQTQRHGASAQDIWMQAALNGRKPIKGKLHDRNGGSCAVGILHETLHESMNETIECHEMLAFAEVEKAFPEIYGRMYEIARNNDCFDWDFLMFARKLEDIPVSHKYGWVKP